MSGEPAQDEFVDSRDEQVDPEAGGEESGGGDDMVFLDEAVDDPAAAPAPKPMPAKPAGGPGSGGHTRPAQAVGAPVRPPAAPVRPAPSTPGTGGQTRPPTPPPGMGSGVHGRPPAGKRPGSDSGVLPAPGSGRRPSSDAGLKRSSDSQRAARPDSARQGAQAASSGRHKPLGPSQRPERTRDEEMAALAALDARVAAAPQGDVYIGKELGPFKVDGFVEVDRGERRYKAILTDQQRPVLLRVFPLIGSWADEFKRIADRAERVCRIESPHLESALFAGRTKEAFYAGFDPPLGRTLTDLLRESALDEPATLALVEQVTRGLQAMHGRDMVHAHVSPDVIRQLRPGTWILEQAGLARTRPALGFLASGGDVLGLPGFIAPETIDSGEQTKVADLYSLGCVAWAAACAKPPFRGDDEVQILLDQLNKEVPPLQLASGQPPSRPFDTIVRKLTGYTPDVRYRDAKDVSMDLRARERGEEVKPFDSPIKAADAPAPVKLRGSATALVVLAVIDVVLILALVLIVSRVRTIELRDPVEGWELPLPAAPAPGVPLIEPR